MPIFLTSLLSKIGTRGGLMIAMGLALAFVMWRADTLSDRLEAANQWKADITATTRIASGVDNLSPKDVGKQIQFLGEGVSLLKTEIASLNAQANARAEAYEISRQNAVKEAERLNKQAKASQGQIDRLKALGSAQGSSGCVVPNDIVRELEGL